MNSTSLEKVSSEPYRIYFPIGIFYLFWGALVWVPLLWNESEYPVLMHRYLMLNGFTASFIGGFLMTALPRFSQTPTARSFELIIFFCITITGLFFAWLEQEKIVFLFSAFQPMTILFFILSRISKRKENPPYSFIFIFVGLFLWIFSGLGSAFFDGENLKDLHYEGAISAIIFGVGSRLVPGILGHMEIVSTRRKEYEQVKPLLRNVPLPFFGLVLFFALSYLMPHPAGALLRMGIATVIALFYWKLWKFPTDRCALTWSIWVSCWFTVLSFALKAFWDEGLIHIGHSFFISGIVLLSLLVGTRVIQSHGPKDKGLENSKVLYLVSFLLILAGATRVSAYFMPESYLHHLAYSSIILVLSVAIWSLKYLRFVF